MKKIVILTLILSSIFLFQAFYNIKNINPTYAATTSTANWNEEASLKRVNTIGATILKANNLPEGITFKVSHDESINAYANINKEV